MSAFFVYFGLAAGQICFFGFNELAPLDNLPSHEKDQAVWQTKVRRDESLDAKRRKGIKADEYQGDAAHGEGEVGRVGCEWRRVW